MAGLQGRATHGRSTSGVIAGFKNAVDRKVQLLHRLVTEAAGPLVRVVPPSVVASGGLEMTRCVGPPLFALLAIR